MYVIYFGYATIKWRTISKYYFLLVLYTAAQSAAVFETVIVPLTGMYASLLSHKFDLIIDILKLMLLLLFLLLLLVYAPRDSSFISMQFLVLNLEV